LNPHGENTDGERRLRRLEDFVEVLANEHIQFAEEHRRLLTAQVVLTDRVDKLAQRIESLAEVQAHTDERLSVLIGMMDDWIKRQG
jgi:FtsZ-binding cell division protein ZapB